MTQRPPAEFRSVGDAEAQRANRGDWDREADEYQREHGSFLGNARFVWSPEGVDEEDVRLLGDVEARRVLEIGCGAGQCARWLRTQGAVVVGVDLSYRQLQHSRRLDEETSFVVPTACATATALPFEAHSFDLACSAFGALPFLVDIGTALGEVGRVLRPGGRFVFSVVHPLRQMFSDDPTERGLLVSRSYFDSAAYVESDADGNPTYVEAHHTLGDWIGAIMAAGLTVDSLLEPEWPAGHTRVWGAWGPERGALMPGTAIFTVTRRLPP
ncbi:MAG: class I SAM-dependent methyltransferase [Actinomycetota bacterium]|jgi:SAM-dependent methyltransferase|nr:class I SAM-dependent methyltransferase [Actinomycetota bacterium]